MENLVHLLAAVPPAPAPFISAYVSLLPDLQSGAASFAEPVDEASARSWRHRRSPAFLSSRPGITVLSKLLREKDDLLPKHGIDPESFNADAERIMDYLYNAKFNSSSKGCVFFACHAANVWHVLEFPMAIETVLSVTKRPLVSPLVEVQQLYFRYVVATLDDDVSRIFLIELGQILQTEQMPTPPIGQGDDRGTGEIKIEHRKEKTVAAHLKTVASRIEAVAAQSGAHHIVIIGDEEHREHITKQIGKGLLDIVIAREDLSPYIEEKHVIEKTLDSIYEAEVAAANALIGDIIGEATAGRLGAAGPQDVQASLAAAAVDKLILDKATGSPGWRATSAQIAGITLEAVPAPARPNLPQTLEVREEFVVAAVNTGADIDFAEHNPELIKAGSMAARLRFRPPLPSEQ